MVKVKKKKSKTVGEVTNAVYEDLANAIVLQACKDYKSAYKHYLRRYGRADRTDPQLAELEKFFRSDWYKTLTSVDGEYLMKRLQNEVVEELKGNKNKATYLKSH